MEYVTSVERIGIRKGIDIGWKQGFIIGFKEGFKIGFKEGRQEGLLESITSILNSKFGPDGLKLLRQVRGFNVSELRKFGRFLNNAQSADEVRGYLEKH
ncbi:MAG: hypothetical protein EXS16_04730 [Gemmataceae bacterium]|nr:hypothetical protein [Gemmataceae bacterium]